ncbi:ABC transporter permease [Mesorhizobium sp. INR15]|uniref:ABC transporter permease n=1 Tax=Mesorhizobium sp. INR15 TaxID=2654248 RepID=UPI002156654C|nr:ABC transporter permease [Mesorhizobium sp. INR15]
MLALAITVAVFLLGPLVFVLPISFTDRNYLSMPSQGLSLAHYEALWLKPGWISSLLQSTGIAISATLLATVAGTLCALGCRRAGGSLSSSIRSVMILPAVIPSIVYALGIYKLWIDLNLLDTYVGVILAHGVMGIPYVVITVSAALSNFDAKLEDAAAGLGAYPIARLRLIILPNIAPGIFSGALFAFLNSWDELVVVLFIASRRVVTLPRQIWDGINEDLDPSIAAVALLLIVLSATLLFTDQALRRRQD